MAISMITQKYFSRRVVFVVFLNGVTIWENDDWQIVKFWYGLKFDFIPPCAELSFKSNIAIYINGTILLKELLIKLNIIHWEFSNNLMFIFCSIKMITNCSKKTISIPSYFNNFKSILVKTLRQSKISFLKKLLMINLLLS